MKESVSLYKDYMDFLKEYAQVGSEFEEVSKKLLRNGFKGFVSNRLRRVCELSEITEEHKEMLDTVFLFFRPS